MTGRTRLVLTVVAVLALASAVGATIAARSGSDSEPAAVVEEVGSQGFEGPKSPFKGAVRPPSPPRDFELRDQEGRLVRLADLRGRVVVLTPMYTTCRASCPLVAQQIRDAISDLEPVERAQVRALALSVDPSHDTPEQARRFLVTRRVLGYMDFLLGTRQELAPVWKDYGFAPQTTEREHNSYVVLIDKRGRQRVGFPIDFLTPEGLGHDMRLLLAEPTRSRQGPR